MTDSPLKKPRYLAHEVVVSGLFEPSSPPALPTPTPAAVAAPPLKAEPALALLEFSSIARGMVAADAMVKRAQVELIHAGTVQPGRYLVLLGGPVGEVEEALAAGRSVGGDALDDVVWLPGVHPAVMAALHPADHPPRDLHRSPDHDALGIIETRTAPAAIHAGDVAVKGAEIHLFSIRLSDGLDGKGLTLISGKVADVEAALDLVRQALDGLLLLHAVVIPQLHADFARNIFSVTRFFRPTLPAQPE